MTGAKQGTPEWLAERRTMIGASEAAAAMGLSPWTTPLELYLRKRGELPEAEETMAMRRGKALEPVILDAYERRTDGHWLVRSPPIYRHKEYPWMGTSFDALRFAGGCTTRPRVVEAKAVSFFASKAFGDPGTDEVPDYYLIQVQHQLEVALSIWPDADNVADLVALVDGEDEERVYPIAYCPEVAHEIVERERELWDRITTGGPPDPTCRADIEALYQRSRPVTVEATPDVILSCSRVATLKARIKEEEEELDRYLEVIQLAMLDAEVLAFRGQTLATWKTGKPRRSLDLDAMRAKHPKLVEKFTREGKAARTFLLKERKS